MKRRELLLTGGWSCCPARPGRRLGARSSTRRDDRSRSRARRADLRRRAAGDILVFAIAPDKLIGWTTAWREVEKPYVAKKYADLPTLGRLTGRGNTANVEVVLGAKPDVILDYGTVNATYSSLADRVQEQTGTPYLLVDGDFDRMVDSIRLIGQIAQEEKRAAALALYAQDTISDIERRVATIPGGQRPRVYYARGPGTTFPEVPPSITPTFAVVSSSSRPSRIRETAPRRRRRAPAVAPARSRRAPRSRELGDDPLLRRRGDDHRTDAPSWSKTNRAASEDTELQGLRAEQPCPSATVNTSSTPPAGGRATWRATSSMKTATAALSSAPRTVAPRLRTTPSALDLLRRASWDRVEVGAEHRRRLTTPGSRATRLPAPSRCRARRVVLVHLEAERSQLGGIA